MQKICPAGVTMKLEFLHGSDPAMAMARAAIERAYGVKPVALGEGGSIPVVGEFQASLQVPCILLALGQPNNNAHAPNEWMSATAFKKAISTNCFLYEEKSPVV